MRSSYGGKNNHPKQQWEHLQCKKKKAGGATTSCCKERGVRYSRTKMETCQNNSEVEIHRETMFPINLCLHSSNNNLP